MRIRSRRLSLSPTATPRVTDLMRTVVTAVAKSSSK